MLSVFLNGNFIGKTNISTKDVVNNAMVELGIGHGLFDDGLFIGKLSRIVVETNRVILITDSNEVEYKYED